MNTKLEDEIRDLVTAAKKYSTCFALSSHDERNQLLHDLAAALRTNEQTILAANEQDLDEAHSDNMSPSLLDRLTLNSQRIEAMAQGLEALAALPDTLGRVLEDRYLPNDLHLQRVSVPLGVVAMIYEARPNVTIDAIGICIKTGNACVLRSGKAALATSCVLAHLAQNVLACAGMPSELVALIERPEREAADILMRLHGLVDVLIPRGGAGLIRHCVENAQVPVIETGTGNCHVYIHEQAKPDSAVSIVVNAKTQRFGVCNACESVLIDRTCAHHVLPLLLAPLCEAGITCHMDAESLEIAHSAISDQSTQFVLATNKDWGREYLGPEISIKLVDGVDEAIAHINQYGTHHSEAIVTENSQVIEHFLRGVDAAAVYANASTRFTDGAEFGLGAEIGISTQKLHVRGPFATEALTTYKYLLRGNGQVR